MVQVVKSEWHQIERRFSIDLDENLLKKIYPDYDDEEIAVVLQQLADGVCPIGAIIDDADAEGADIDWDWMDEDDMRTDRKGGYEVTYEVKD